MTLVLALVPLASALLPSFRFPSGCLHAAPIRVPFRAGQPLLAEPSAKKQTVDECIVEAENAAELSACADPADPSLSPRPFAGATFKDAPATVTPESKRSALMGPAESLQECLSEAGQHGQTPRFADVGSCAP